MIRLAKHNDIEAVTAIYEHIHMMEADGLVRIGWNPSIYPVRATAEEALQRGDLFVFEQEGTIMASAIINRTQVPVYAIGQWAFPAADDEVMVLHTLTVDPMYNSSSSKRRSDKRLAIRTSHSHQLNGLVTLADGIHLVA